MSDKPLTPNDYQHKAHATSKYYTGAMNHAHDHKLSELARHMRLSATLSGLTEEVGELHRHMNRLIRDDKPLDKQAFVDELGDVLWFVAELATLMHTTLGDVMQANLDKLGKRDAINAIHGEGVRLSDFLKDYDPQTSNELQAQIDALTDNERAKLYEGIRRDYDINDALDFACGMMLDPTYGDIPDDTRDNE